MPNWCSTTIDIKSKRHGKEIYAKFMDWSKKDVVPNDFSQWLGNIIVNSGISDSYEDYRCRGEISYALCDEDSVRIETETAWTPCLKLFLDALEKNFPKDRYHWEFFFEATEPGCELYVSNKEQLGEQYIVDTVDHGILFVRKDKLQEDLNRLDFKSSNEEYSVYQWDIISLDEAKKFF